MSQSTLPVASASAAASTSSLFPLPVVAFEKMFLADDRPEYPMVSSKELVFSGHFDRDALRRAIERSVARHPLLTAFVRRERGGGLMWVQAGRGPEIDWGSADDPIMGLRNYVDLSREVGAKFWVRQGVDETRILIRMHHACCDGFGALQLLEDICAAYIAEHSGSTDIGWRELQPELLRRRGDFSALRKEQAQQPVHRGRKLFENVRFLLRKPTPLATPQPAPTSSNANDGNTTRDLGPDLLRALRRAASGNQATLNDVLLRDLFLVLSNWNRQHVKRPGKWLRILMPCNLREAEFQNMPAANRMGYSFLTRSMDQCDRPDDLLRSISDETKKIRGQRRYLDWMRGLELTQASRLGMAWMTRRSQCFCTVVLSNLGDPMRAFEPEVLRQRGKMQLGDATLESLAAHTPMRRNTHGGFLVSTYDGRLSVSLSCDPHRFTADSVEALLTRFSRRLAATAGGASCERTS